MSNESVVVIILRLAGFYIGAVAIPRAVLILPSVPFGHAASMRTWAIWLLYTLVVLAFCWFLIRFPRLITRKLLARKEAEETTQGWTADDLQAVLFAVLGLYFIATTVSAMVGWVAELGFTAAYPNTRVVLHFDYDDVVAKLVQLGIGLWLLFGAKGLRGLVSKARRAGQ